MEVFMTLLLTLLAAALCPFSFWLGRRFERYSGPEASFLAKVRSLWRSMP